MEYGFLDRCPAGRTRERAFAVLRKHTRHTGTANLLYYPFLTPPPQKPSLIEWLQQLAVSHSLRLAFDHSLSVILGVTRSIGLPPLFTPSLPSQVSSHFVPPCLSHTFYLSLLSQKSDQ